MDQPFTPVSGKKGQARPAPPLSWPRAAVWERRDTRHYMEVASHPEQPAKRWVGHTGWDPPPHITTPSQAGDGRWPAHFQTPAPCTNSQQGPSVKLCQYLEVISFFFLSFQEFPPHLTVNFQRLPWIWQPRLGHQPQLPSCWHYRVGTTQNVRPKGAILRQQKPNFLQAQPSTLFSIPKGPLNTHFPLLHPSCTPQSTPRFPTLLKGLKFKRPKASRYIMQLAGWIHSIHPP